MASLNPSRGLSIASEAELALVLRTRAAADSKALGAYRDVMRSLAGESAGSWSSRRVLAELTHAVWRGHVPRTDEPGCGCAKRCCDGSEPAVEASAFGSSGGWGTPNSGQGMFMARAGEQKNKNIHFRFGAFIPCEAVPIPAPVVPSQLYRKWSHYRGDDRFDARAQRAIFDFAKAKENVRISVSALVNLQQGFVGKSGFMNYSYAYTGDQVESGSGLCLRFKPGQIDRPKEKKRDENRLFRFETRPDSRSNAGADIVGRTYFLSMRATDPIPWGPVPSLTGEVTIHVLYRASTGEPIEFVAKGSRTQFPAFEFYVNGHAVHTYDPIAAGRDLFGLTRTDAWQTRNIPVREFAPGVRP